VNVRKFSHRYLLVIFSLIISLAFVLSGCGGSKGGRSGTGQTPSNDTTPPTISSTLPANGATQTPTNTTVRAVFSEPINPDTLTSNTFVVLAVGTSGGATVSGTVAYTAETMTATFIPTTLLEINTTYTITITTGVEDEAGNAMATTFSWSFTTGTAVDNTSPSFPGGDPQLVAQATSSNSISLEWVAATDNTTPQNQLVYVVCRSTISTDCTASPFPSAGGNVAITETTAGQITLGVTGLSSNTTYYFVVRAKDQVNLMDSNVAQKSAITPGSFKSLYTSLNNTFTKPAIEPSIATVGTTVYVAWQEGNTPSDIFIKSFDTTLPANSDPTTPPEQRVWLNVPVTEINSAGNHQKQPRLASDRSNSPKLYITYTECDSTGENCNVYVRRLEGSTWTLVGPGALNTNSAESSAIAFDQTNNPYVIWIEEDDSNPAITQVLVARFDGNNWIQMPDDPGDPLNVSINEDSEKNAFSPAIAINGSTIRTAWVECIATNSSKCRVYAKGWTGTAWTLIGTTYLNVGDPNFIQAYSPSLAFINSVLHISWHEADKVYVRKEEGSSFVAVGTFSNFVSAASNIPIAGTATSSQTLYLVFAENSSTPSTTGPFLIAKRWNGSAWVTEGITGTNPTGTLNITNGNGSPINSSITFVDGTPYIAWTETGFCSTASLCGNNSGTSQLYVKRLE
jgi:hypothetical protein